MNIIEIITMDHRKVDAIFIEIAATIEKLMADVKDHVRQEENDLFPYIRRNLSEVQMEQMATQFKEAKSQLQQKMASSKS